MRKIVASFVFCVFIASPVFGKPIGLKKLDPEEWELVKKLIAYELDTFRSVLQFKIRLAGSADKLSADDVALMQRVVQGVYDDSIEQVEKWTDR